MTNSSINFYNSNAKAYFASTVDVNMADVRHRFLAHLAPASLILDAGCGSGRDTREFLQAGYQVEAFDASTELAAMARVHTGLPVPVKTFSQMTDQAVFDGVWACSSLVHLDAVTLQDALSRLSASLKADGWLYTCFRQGPAAYTDARGRYFNCYAEAETAQLMESSGLTVGEIWATPHLLDPSLFWVNVLAQKRSN